MNYLINQSIQLGSYATYHLQVFSLVPPPPLKDAMSLVRSIFFILRQIAVK